MIAGITVDGDISYETVCHTLQEMETKAIALGLNECERRTVREGLSENIPVVMMSRITVEQLKQAGLIWS